MADHPSPFESKIDAVLRRVEEIDHRVRALEARFGDLPAPETDALPSGEQTRPLDRLSSYQGFSPVAIASLTGRTFLVLGGGYLLRALADFGILPLPLAVVLGLAYAIGWFVMADRAGASRKTASATFHALAATALAFPLLFEVIVKFKLLQAWHVAIGLTAVAALGMTVGWWRQLQGVVWIVSAASIVTAFALLRVGEDIAPFALHLVLVATLTYWIADARHWWRVRWPSAIAADAAVVWLAMHAGPPQNPLQLTLAIAVALALFGLSFGSFAVRMLVLGQDVIRFEVFQSVAALLAGYGGAAYIARASSVSTIPYGWTGLLLGACVYGVVFERGAARLTPRHFHYFSTVAIALVIAGGTLTFRPPLAAVLWIVLAPTGVVLGKRFSYATLSAHGAAYLVAASVASGLFAEAGSGLLGSAMLSWREVTPVALLALAAAAACSAVSPLGVRAFGAAKRLKVVAAHRGSVAVPRAIALGILVLGLSGIAILWIVPVVLDSPGRESDWGIVATIRTITLAAAVVLMGLLARGDRVREAGWLIYPLLIAAGLKILLEDFRQSEPATLFLALLVYGSALIVGPRLASK